MSMHKSSNPIFHDVAASNIGRPRTGIKVDSHKRKSNGMSGIISNDKGRETRRKMAAPAASNPITGSGIATDRVSSKGAAKPHTTNMGNLATYMGDSNVPLKTSRRPASRSAFAESAETVKPVQKHNTSQQKSTINSDDCENSGKTRRQINSFEKTGRTKMHGSNILGKQQKSATPAKRALRPRSAANNNSNDMGKTLQWN